MTRFDDWLTNQPFEDRIHMTAPSAAELNEYSEYYPVDEWSCRDCRRPVGYHLSGDHAGGWSDYWLIETTDEMICDDCMEVLTAEPAH